MMIDINELRKYGEVIENSSFKKITTLRIGGAIDYLVKPNSIEELKALMSYIKTNKIPYLVIGNGSNVLASDNKFEGIVINLGKLKDIKIAQNEIYAEAGVSAIRLAQLAMENNLSGLEFISGIPGSIGGLIFMNAGAYKKEIKDILIDVLVLKDSELVLMNKDELGFSYRHSIFKEHRDWIIVAARFSLDVSNKEDIKNLMDKRRAKRIATQPQNMPSCGSCFKNPENDFSWRLIDETGNRGYRLNDILVSDKHCNFILNAKNGTAKDFLLVVDKVKKDVKDKFNIELNLEVEVLEW